MIQFTFVTPSGEEREVQTKAGFSLMEVGVQNNIAGILGQCGGACACATCHVVLDKSLFDAVPPAELNEADLLDELETKQPFSRLSCQIVVQDCFESTKIHVAEAIF